MRGSINIAAVSYINTIPFVYGIEHTSESLSANLTLAIPKECAELFKSKKVDVALVPLATTLEFSDYNIVTPYCIASDDAVRTVVLMCDCEKTKIERIFLDSHSRTSVELVKILARELWKITPVFEELTDYELIGKCSQNDAYLLIGDKVFDFEDQFSQKIDLCSEWIEFTGKPFVFAVWVAHKNVTNLQIETLSDSLAYGIDCIESAAKEYRCKDYKFVTEYLTKNIKFHLSDDKREGMKLFLRYLEQESEPSSHFN
ncbi:MAG: menaquinone biosynthesis protein [Rikenellaceae bacterium]